MKRFLLITILLTIVCLFLFLREESALEIRIIPNSNSEEDRCKAIEIGAYLVDEVLPKKGLTKDFFKENIDLIKDKISTKFPNVFVNFTKYKFRSNSYIANEVLTLLIKIESSLGESLIYSINDGSVIECYSDIKYNWFMKRGF